MTLDNFCTRLSKMSPCLMTAWYCQFFESGRLVSTMPPTLSILQWRRPAAMYRDNSLERDKEKAEQSELWKECSWLKFIHHWVASVILPASTDPSSLWLRCMALKCIHLSFIIIIHQVVTNILIKKWDCKKVTKCSIMKEIIPENWTTDTSLYFICITHTHQDKKMGHSVPNSVLLRYKWVQIVISNNVPPVNELCGDSKGCSHVLEGEGAVRL